MSQNQAWGKLNCKKFQIRATKTIFDIAIYGGVRTGGSNITNKSQKPGYSIWRATSTESKAQPVREAHTKSG